MIHQIKKLAFIYFNEIVEIRRHLHQYPELSFHEYKTSAYIKSILTKWHIPFTDGIADTGIVVVLEGNNPELKTLALRADFDALPIQEENDIVYRFTAVENSGISVHEDYVRLIHAAGEWRIHSLDSSSTEVTYIWNGELLGNFPEWALSRAWETQGHEVLTWLKEAVK